MDVLEQTRALLGDEHEPWVVIFGGSPGGYRLACCSCGWRSGAESVEHAARLLDRHRMQRGSEERTC